MGQRRGLQVILLVLGVILWSRAEAQPATMWPEVEALTVVIDGEPVRLVMKVYRPPGPGPFPTLIFHHGSTGFGRGPSLFVRFADAPAVELFFVQRGWAVVRPQRRGRGGSEGLYDEGFRADRSQGYSCDPVEALLGADRALRDITAATDAIRAMPFVDGARLLVGGVSRGGILSVAYAGQHPAKVRGVVNFVGGWSGEGCAAATEINGSLFRRGTPFPGESLWLYGDNDRFYSLVHSRGNHAAFLTAGGRAAYADFRLPNGTDGHALSGFSDQWARNVTEYLRGLGLPADRIFKEEALFPAPSAPATAFVGRWAGAWDGLLPTSLTVESVTAEGELVGTLRVGNADAPIRGALQKHALYISGSRGNSRFWLEGDELRGTFVPVGGGDVANTVTMRRTPTP